MLTFAENFIIAAEGSRRIQSLRSSAAAPACHLAGYLAGYQSDFVPPIVSFRVPRCLLT